MKLSIITINYNNYDGLKATVASVMSQTYRDFEWIIIDGGSKDGSKEVIEEVAVNPNSNITYWCSEPDNGIYHAMNKGIAKANGKYFLFLNSGDTLYKENVLEQVYSNTFEEDFIVCHLYNNYENDVYKKTQMLNAQTISIDTLMTCPLPQPSTFIKSSLFERVGKFDEKMRICSDLKFFIEAIVYHSASYKYLPIVLTVFDEHGISSSGSDLHLSERAQLRNSYFPPRIQLDYVKFRDLETYVEVIKKHKFLGIILKIIHQIAIFI